MFSWGEGEFPRGEIRREAGAVVWALEPAGSPPCDASLSIEKHVAPQGEASLPGLPGT